LVEIPVGRIVGASATDMEKFINNGVRRPIETNPVVLAALQDWGSDWHPWDEEYADIDMAEGWLNNKWEVYKFTGTSWSKDDVLDKLDKPFSIFLH